MKREETYKWRTLWNGKMSPTRFHCTEEFIKAKHPEAERIEDGEGGYAMNHTAGVFLFRADGRFGSLIDFHEDRAFALPKIRRVLD